MFCSNCGNKLDEGMTFCNKCGNKVTNVSQKSEKKSSGSKKKLVIIILLVMIILLLIILAISLTKGSNRRLNDGSRTIMIYMAGSNLESDGSIATSDLDSILPDEIDLSKMNVLLYTGSTKIWHNFASSDENAIYLLKEDGFEKLESYDPKSLGDSDVFKSFLDYSYENYVSESYDLIFWNHGLGALGSISDEDSNDFLTLPEMSQALKNSKFNKRNKLDTVLFRTCLNATYEVANVFSDYANYMIASEEITIGSSNTSVLNFINDIDSSDDGVSYGKKFINSYKEQVDDIDFFATTDSTYSIINLTKMDELEDKMNDFFEEIDVKENYNEIAKIRSNMHQYAVETANSENYDTVDLYDLVESLKSYSEDDAKELLEVFDDMVEYNWSTNDNSHGLSIYFPFNGNKNSKKMHMEFYNKLVFSEDYNKFIKKFNNIQASNSNFNFNIQSNETTMNNKEFSLKLTDEQIENYASSSYIIFKKTDDNYFVPLYSSTNATLGSDGVIKTNVDNNLIKVVDKSNNSESYIQAFETSSKDREYITSVVLSKISDNIEDMKINAANMYIKIDKNNTPVITKTMLIDKNSASGAVINYKDYTTIEFGNFRYNILDENGNYNEDWESSETKYLYEVETNNNNIEFKTASLDDDNDYYCVFKVKDVKNNYYYSKLIKIN